MAGYHRNPAQSLDKAQKQLEAYLDGEMAHGNTA